METISLSNSNQMETKKSQLITIIVLLALHLILSQPNSLMVKIIMLKSSMILLLLPLLPHPPLPLPPPLQTFQFFWMTWKNQSFVHVSIPKKSLELRVFGWGLRARQEGSLKLMPFWGGRCSLTRKKNKNFVNNRETKSKNDRDGNDTKIGR